jgi:hypothetical protein
MNTKKQSFIALIMVCSLAALCAVIVLLGIAPAHAAGPSAPSTAPANPLATTWVVTSSADSGAGTLRAAIAAAASGDTITFAGDYTIYLANTLTISQHLTIDGGNHAIILSGDTGNNGSPNVWIFSINSSGVATLTHLSIVSGTAPLPLSGAGGAILNNQGKVTVQNITLSGNSADNFGGGIMNNQGTLTVRNSTLSGNSAGNGANTTGGGGIMNNGGTVTVQNSTFSGNVARVNSLGGGILNNNGTVTVENSTFSGNSAGVGGGIRNWGTLVVTNSTFSGNSASLAGGGIAHDYSGGVLLSMSNTIIANSSSGGDCYNYHSVPLNNHNLIEDGSCGPTLSGDPLLGSLADNGGLTWTFALLPGSAAIDAGNETACPATDQREVARPQGAACDIGAYESQGFLLTKTGGDNQSTSINTTFTQPLVISVTSAFSEPVNGGAVTFAGPLSGAGINPIITTVTIANGVVAHSLAANGLLGSYPVEAHANGATSTTFTLTNLIHVYLPLVAK